MNLQEWKNQPIGTEAIRIKTYDGNTGKLVGLVYFIPSEIEEIEDEQQVADGYFTETCKVTKK